MPYRIIRVKAALMIRVFILSGPFSLRTLPDSRRDSFTYIIMLRTYLVMSDFVLLLKFFKIILTCVKTHFYAVRPDSTRRQVLNLRSIRAGKGLFSMHKTAVSVRNISRVFLLRSLTDLLPIFIGF